MTADIHRLRIAHIQGAQPEITKGRMVTIWFEEEWGDPSKKAPIPADECDWNHPDDPILYYRVEATPETKGGPASGGLYNTREAPETFHGLPHGGEKVVVHALADEVAQRDIEIETLTSERDHAQNHSQDLYDEIVKLRTERDALKAEVAQLRTELELKEQTVERFAGALVKETEQAPKRGNPLPLPRNNTPIPWQLDWSFLSQLHRAANSIEDGMATHTAVEEIALAVERHIVNKMNGGAK